MGVSSNHHVNIFSRTSSISFKANLGVELDIMALWEVYLVLDLYNIDVKTRLMMALLCLLHTNAIALFLWLSTFLINSLDWLVI